MEMESGLEKVNLEKLKVADLKKLLKEKNLHMTGKKPDLIKRLVDAGVGVTSENITGNTSEEKEELDDDILNDQEDEIEPEKDSDALQSSLSVGVIDTEKPSEVATEEPSQTEQDSTVTITKISAPEPEPATDKLAERQKRFGAVSGDAKKKARAERFGIPVTDTKVGSTAATKTTNDKAISVPASTVSAEDLEKMKKRSERFGAVTATALTKECETDKLKRRAERFGSVTSPKLSKLDVDENLRKRKERFGVVTGDDVEEKKKKRAERFQAVK